MIKAYQSYISCQEDSLDIRITIGDSEIPLQEINLNHLLLLKNNFRSNNTLQAEYQNWLKSGDLSRAKLIKEKQKIFFNNYGEVEFSLPLDWKLGLPRDDNLNWQLHSMVFLRDLVLAHKKTSTDEYLSLVKTFILDWNTSNVTDNFPSLFSWNDHSTAYRLLALSYVFIYWLEMMPEDIDFIKLLISLVVRHQLVLSDDSFYSKGTNHGLDQSFFLYLSNAAFNFTNYFSSIREISLARLRFEVESSFASDGVHVENSPEYHDIVFYNILKINKVVKEIESVNMLKDFDSFCKSALNFISFILRPDGCWPPIGDSTVRPPRYTYENLSFLSSYEKFCYAVSKGQKGKPTEDLNACFPDSGYFIMRSDPSYLPYEQSIHIVFKCGFLSHYHRHDDDNNVLIFGYGEEWLTEGGLYKHSSEDPQRIHMRSHYAHNLMFPVGIDPIRDRNIFPTTGIVDYSLGPDSARVKGETRMFPGYVYSRELTYKGNSVLYLNDILLKVSNNQTYIADQLWHIPYDKKIEILGNKIKIKSQCSPCYLVVSVESKQFISIEEVDPDKNPYFCWRSTQYNVLEPIKVIRVRYAFEGKSISSSIKFEWFNS